MTWLPWPRHQAAALTPEEDERLAENARRVALIEMETKLAELRTKQMQRSLRRQEQ